MYIIIAVIFPADKFKEVELMFTQPMQIELQSHNGLIGRDESIAPFDSRILDGHLVGIADMTQVPKDAQIKFEGRLFTYAYTVAFPSNGFFVFRETVY